MEFKKTLLWDITSECNLRCKHCYNAEKYFNDKKNKYNILNTEECKNVIISIKRENFDHIHLLGGEPLFRKDIFELIDFARQQNLYVTINTNGTLLNSMNVRRLIKSGINQITISLDAPVETLNDEIRGNGVFNKVISNIKILNSILKETDQNVIVQIATVITEKNAKYVKQFPKLLKQLDIKYLSVLSLYKCGNANKNNKELFYSINTEIQTLRELLCKSKFVYPELYIQLDCKPIVSSYINRISGEIYCQINKSNCRAGDKIWLLEPNGDLYPCGSCNLSTAQDVKERNILMGKALNINKIKSFDEIYNCDLYKSFYKLKSTYIHNKYVCSKCEFNDICTGECPLILKHNYDICDFIINEEEKYYDSLKEKTFKVCNDVLYGVYDENLIAFNIKKGIKKKMNRWKKCIFSNIAQNDNLSIKEIYNSCNINIKPTEIQFSRFILDLNAESYIQEII
ncbi:radical SAM protein [Haloimpatiens sp. FM7315]|uniref:radical SAM protein n=1 Tax=Haloimpatiens sp. FM7315 TaxID=3298609 RepID=UPI00370AD8CF